MQVNEFFMCTWIENLSLATVRITSLFRLSLDTRMKIVNSCSWINPSYQSDSDCKTKLSGSVSPVGEH